MEKIKSFLKNRYLKLLLLLIVSLISIKAIFFTLNIFYANLYLKTNKYKAGAYMARAVNLKSSVYKIFDRHAPGVLEQFLVKSAVYKNDKELLNSFPHPVALTKIKNRFKDNFYVEDLWGDFRKNGDWENLDPVSFDLLSDPSLNSRTTAILEKIAPFSEPGFFKNLADFVYWHNNKALLEYLLATRLTETPPFKVKYSQGCSYEASLSLLKKVLQLEYKLRGEFLGKNLLSCPGFSNKKCMPENWYFSRMAGRRNFSRGSFYMGIDHIGESRNPVIRLMGFFVAHDRGKTNPRAGIRSRKSFTAENGFYIFSFDYCTVTGKEIPSFWLGRRMEKRIPHTRGQWKKVVFILNNAFNQYDSLNPLIRIWGTGTLLVDNVFLAKTPPLKFSIDDPYEIRFAQIIQE